MFFFLYLIVIARSSPHRVATVNSYSRSVTRAHRQMHTNYTWHELIIQFMLIYLLIYYQTEMCSSQKKKHTHIQIYMNVHAGGIWAHADCALKAQLKCPFLLLFAVAHTFVCSLQNAAEKLPIYIRIQHFAFSTCVCSHVPSSHLGWKCKCFK